MARTETLNDHSGVLNIVARLLDAACVVGVGILAYYFYFGTFDIPPEYRSALVVSALMTMLIFPMFGNYSSWRGRSWVDQLRTAVISWGAVVIALVILSVALRNTAAYSRFWFFAWTGGTVIVLFAIKRGMVFVLRLMRRAGLNHKSIVLYGAGELGRMVGERLQEADWTGYDIVAYFDDNEALKGHTVCKAPVHIGSDTNLEKFIRENRIQELWMALPLRAEKRMNEILFSLRHSTVWVRFIPDIFSFRILLNHSITDIAGIPAVDLSFSPMSGLNRYVKAIEDRVLAFLILLLISPLLLLIAIAIKLDSKGPILFKQVRHGWDGELINVYKFRTMHLHQEHGGQVTQATKDDTRVTRVGAFLRRTSLDELPQFYNVLQGRMSIVGPRPHAVAHNEFYKDQVEYYFQRHKVKPGITGWAQINGWRGETDTLEKMKKRVEYDLYYIQNWSLWFDLKIILLTVFKGFVSDKAY